ncbi:MAG: anthranilate synthase component I family protein [Firmicutes bacterium]|nr:anthranilate synthase component I family protein [Bacillota bacterium]
MAMAAGRRDAGLGGGVGPLAGVRVADPVALLRALGDPECVLLEDGRQSFAVLALAPKARIVARPGRPFEVEAGGRVHALAEAGPEGLRRALALAGAERRPAFGLLGYPFAARVERLPLIPDARPDVALMRPGLLLRIDGGRGGEVTLLEEPADEAALAAVREAARALTAGTAPAAGAPPARARVLLPDPEEHREAVRRAIAYVREGEAFQIVVGRPFRVEVPGPALDAYDRLRVHRAGYGGYVHLAGLHLASASPELLVARRGRRVRTMPIAGTRPRGAGPAEDRRLRAELLADPKERAEHAMLLDLGRNDLGRVARFGSVAVTSAFRVGMHPTVLHITSHVQATLAADKDSVDLVAAVFPAGTVSGAPKVRAMELIAELEGEPRGPYAGAFGYLAADGPARLAITLRTAVFAREHPDLAEVWAGGGIVFRSDLEAEGREIQAKARTVLGSCWPGRADTAVLATRAVGR